jgi:iron complex transport system substrate-binding protein
MGQRRPRPLAKLFLLLPWWGIAIQGCDRGAPPAAPITAAKPTVVSLVPAATDLMIGMDATDHLVGVSNYDDNPRVSQLSRVGDYLTTDWERITELHPQLILTQYAPGRTPAGFDEHVRALGSQQENLHIQRLDDIYAALMQLGDVCNEKQKAADATDRLRHQMQNIRDRVSHLPTVPALIVVDETGQDAAGAGSYLDDLLTVAGGQNVLASTMPAWPTLDRETIVRLAPRVILQLLPAASSQVRAQAMQDWSTLADVPAVRDHRIVQLTAPEALMPGYHIGDLAEQFAAALHPEISTTQSAGQSHVAVGFPPPPVFPGEGWGGGANSGKFTIRKDPLPASPGLPGEGKESGEAERGTALTQPATQP